MIDILDLVNSLTLVAVEDGWTANVVAEIDDQRTVTLRTTHGTIVAVFTYNGE